MKRFSPLLFVFLLALPTGCGKKSSSEKPTVHHQHQHSIETEERLIESQAEKIKRDLDLLTDETESLLKKQHARVAKRSRKFSDEISGDTDEILTEISEDAKDDAEDAPEIVDLNEEQPSHRLRKRSPILETDEEITPVEQDENALMADETGDEVEMAEGSEGSGETSEESKSVEAPEDTSIEESELQL